MKSKFKQKTTQAQVQGVNHLLGDGRGESTPSSVAPLGGSDDGANALLYLNSHNSDKSGKTEDGERGQNLSKQKGPMGASIKRDINEEEYVEFFASRNWVYDVSK